VFAYSLRRILTTIPLLFIATFFVYAGVRFAGGDPLARLATCVTCDPSAKQRIVDLYDLDESIWQQYGGWVANAASGDFGQSTSVGEPVSEVLRERGKNTAIVAVPAFVITALLSVALSVYAAVKQYSVGDYVITGLSFVGIAMPTFFFALLLQVFWGVWWQDWTNTKPFYITNMHDDTFLHLLASMTLPVATLVIISVAGESRFGRAAMLETVNSDYVRTARAKGLAMRRVVWRHALRNALIPLVTVWAIDFAFLLGGSVVTETVFSWPGLGPPFLDAIFQGDLNLVMGVTMLSAVIVIVFNLIADLLYGVLDPRIRYD
jgi:peptide/nickel transport system permease protein